MENSQLNELITESILLEQNAASLYKVFADALQEDQEFWWQLHIEEKSHANLIRSAQDSFAKRGKFPYDLVADSIEDLKKSNARIKALTGHYQAHQPTRHEACKVAIELEAEVGELHFDLFMEKDTTRPVEVVFQQLNRDDKDHTQRILDYLGSLPLEV
jgi:hypothetical protein